MASAGKGRFDMSSGAHDSNLSTGRRARRQRSIKWFHSFIEVSCIARTRLPRGIVAESVPKGGTPNLGSFGMRARLEGPLGEVELTFI